MNIEPTIRCQHVYLWVNRRFQSRGQGTGLTPVWNCTLKKKDFAGVCGELGKIGLEKECHKHECPLASKNIPWEKCPFYSPLF